MTMWSVFLGIILVVYDQLTLINSECGCCNDYFGCENQNFIDESTYIDCRGFFGCYYSLDNGGGQLITTSNANIFCGGYYGCGNRNIIEAAGILYCRGHWGCRDVQQLRGDDGIWCTGELSCSSERFSGATVLSNSGFIACYGPDSCYEALAIYAPDTTSGNIFCEGRESCRNVMNEVEAGGSLFCRGYYSCAESDLISTTGTMWCVGEFSCESSSIQVSQGAVACEGQGSCRYSEILSETDGVFCTAEVSCFEAEIIVSNSYLYCSGTQSCVRATVRVDGNLGQLYCDGYFACLGLQPPPQFGLSSVQVGRSAWCRSLQSCAQSDLQIVDDAWCDGSNSCQSATLMVGGQTYCDGRQSCAFADILGGEDIHCRSDHACWFARITAGHGSDVYCTNVNSCTNAEIILSVTGGGEIIGVGGSRRRLQQDEENINVYVYAYHAATNANFIVTDDDTIVNFYFYGFESGDGAIIECKTSTCNVFCQGNGCQGLTFTCGGSCNVECDESMNINCPILDATYRPTNNPTPNPVPQVTTECDS